MESGLADLKQNISTYRTESGFAWSQTEQFPLIEQNQASLISYWKTPTYRTESGLADLKLNIPQLFKGNIGASLQGSVI